MNEIVDMIRMIATTIIISSRVKPLVRLVRCDGLVRRFFINVSETELLSLLLPIIDSRAAEQSCADCPWI